MLPAVKNSPSSSAGVATMASEGGVAVLPTVAQQLEHGSVVISAHHELHEHVEPERDDRRWSPGQKAVERGLATSAVGKDQSGSRLEGGDRVPSSVGTPSYLESARLRPGRLRLHDVYRQQRAAARRRVGRSGRDEIWSWPRF